MRLKFIIGAALLLVLNVNAQEATVFPLSFAHFDELNPAPAVAFGGLNMAKIQEEDLAQDEAGGMTYFGRVIEQSLHSDVDGMWSELSDGSKVWRIALESENAMGMAVYFNHFEMPDGGSLFVYDESLRQLDGPYTSAQMNNHGRYLTGTIIGSKIILEYNQPAYVNGLPEFDIKGIGHFYRYIYDYSNEEEARGGSEACEVDVACPEGDNWQEEKDAVVRLQITDGQFIGLCSGVLVNTTARDCRPYLLSALHCTIGVSDADFGFLQVRFNYSRPLCGSGFFPTNRNVTGVTHLADSNDGGGENGSDFVLLEIEDEIPSGWTPFFAGWRASNSGSTSGVTIHHPAGDVKKISTYASALQSIWLGAPGSHWGVQWVETVTNHGVTEGGSSGSPIFDSNKKVIGTLTGGNSFCASPNSQDYYGKMSYHWLNNPNPANEKLKVWLDPLNTGEMEIEGSYVPCENQVGVENTPEMQNVLSLYPNPGNGVFSFKTDKAVAGLDVVDARGVLVFSTGALTQNQIDLSQLPAGIYIVTLHFVDGLQQSGRISKL